MPDTEPDENEEPEEKGNRELNTTTLSQEEWFEELNKCDRLHQYAKKRKEKSSEKEQEKSGEEKREESGEERREELKEGTTLSTKEWIETLNKHDDFEQYAKGLLPLEGERSEPPS